MHLLQIHLKPSKSFLILQLFILLGALLSIFCSFLPYYMQLLLSTGALIYGGYILWAEVLLLSQRAVVSISCRPDQSWQLKERAGKAYEAVLCGDSTRFGWLTILQFKAVPGLGGLDRQRRKVVIFRDAIDAASYRQLLMRLGTL